MTDTINLISQYLSASLSGITTNIFYYELPNEEILEEISVIYEVTQLPSDASFYSLSLNEITEVSVKIISKTKSDVLDNSIYVLKAVNNLFKDHKIKAVSDNGSTLEFDDEINVYKNTINYRITL